MKKLMLALAIAIGMTSVHAADPKPAPKMDCTKPANKNKGPCLKAPESKVKPTIAPPADKSVKKAPAATQKKAAENNAKQ
jgi:hypothetical protein